MKRLLLILVCLPALMILLSVCANAAPDGYLVQIPESNLSTVRAMGVSLEPVCEDVYLIHSETDLSALRSIGLVLYAEPNETMTLEANSWNIDAIHASSAWNHRSPAGQYDRRGDGVTVAVVDSGIQADHEDLDPARILPYKDYGSNENGVDMWHGTFVAGIIAARLDNNLDIDGVAPGVTLLPVTVTSNNGTSNTATAIRGIQYAADNGADVINLSIGGTVNSSFLERTCRNASKSGVILVAAAGNFKKSETPSENAVTYPAGYDFVVSVSSCKQTVDGPAFADDYSYFNKSVDVCAPGSNIRSLYLNGSTAVASGTSFAAPMVSAMAAIAKQTNPAIGTETFLALLEATSTDLGDPGRDIRYGMGFVNMEAFIAKLDEQYPIHYISEVDPSQIDGELRTEYTIADGEIPLPAPSRSGWSFLGWYENPEFTGDPVTKIPAASMGERSFYAKWEQLPNAAPVLTPTAPSFADAVPASLDALTAAIPYAADVSDWFTDPDGDALTYTLISGPGSLAGTVLTYTPGPGDAQTEVPLTVRAEDGFGHNVEHTVTVRVGPRPASQPTLTDDAAPELYDPPATLPIGLNLYDSHVTAVQLDGADIEWRMEGETLFVSVPAAEAGDHVLRIEFDAGEPVSCTLRVISARYVYVRADAPAQGSANPASLDGVTSATPYSADVSGWFSEPEDRPLTYEKTAGPGSMDGTRYSFTPAAADANTDASVTVRASDGLGHSAEHSLTIHVGALPPSQPVLADPDDMIALDLCRPPKSVPVDLILYGARVTSVRLGDLELTWKLNGQTLSVDVPALSPGEYELIIAFDTGNPVAWPWHVFYSAAGPTVRADAPAAADAAPDVPFRADVSAWFSGENLQYTLVFGPGSLDGAVFAFTPAAEDADTEQPVTVRATDPYGQSAMHTVLIHVRAPAGQPALSEDTLVLTDCTLPREIRAGLTLNGAQLAAVRLSGRELGWRLEDGALVVSAPALDPGEYAVSIEFDACAPIVWRWQVRECPSAAFRDVSRGPWYHSAVDWAVENELMNGVASDRFAPQGDFTRAMLVTVLYRASGSPEAPAGCPFTDVAPDRWYSDAVAWAAREGIVNGMTPDRFAPDAPITREQLVTVLFRWAGDDGVRADLSAFPDAGSVARYARDAMAWAVGRGIVNGVGSGSVSTLSPRAGASRAQVAAMLMRCLTQDRPMEVIR